MLKRSYVRVAAVASSVSVVSSAFLPKTLLQSRILGLIKVQRLSRVCLVLFGAIMSRILSALTFAEKRRKGKRRGGYAGQPETSLVGQKYGALLISKPYRLCVCVRCVCVCLSLKKSSRPLYVQLYSICAAAKSVDLSHV